MFLLARFNDPLMKPGQRSPTSILILGIDRRSASSGGKEKSFQAMT
jgi:hypothetical protein